jgi:hypothetical protein
MFYLEKKENSSQNKNKIIIILIRNQSFWVCSPTVMPSRLLEYRDKRKEERARDR